MSSDARISGVLAARGSEPFPAGTARSFRLEHPSVRFGVAVPLGSPMSTPRGQRNSSPRTKRASSGTRTADNSEHPQGRSTAQTRLPRSRRIIGKYLLLTFAGEFEQINWPLKVALPSSAQASRLHQHGRQRCGFGARGMPLKWLYPGIFCARGSLVSTKSNMKRPFY